MDILFYGVPTVMTTVEENITTVEKTFQIYAWNHSILFFLSHTLSFNDLPKYREQDILKPSKTNRGIDYAIFSQSWSGHQELFSWRLGLSATVNQRPTLILEIYTKYRKITVKLNELTWSPSVSLRIQSHEITETVMTFGLGELLTYQGISVLLLDSTILCYHCCFQRIYLQTQPSKARN